MTPYKDACRAWFGFTLLIALLSWSAWARFFLLFHACGLLDEEQLHAYSVTAGSLCVRVMLLANPQIKRKLDYDYTKFENEAKGCVVIANHASYIDMFLVLSAFPARVLLKRKVRPVAAAALVEHIPVIGKTFEYSGAFKVYFQAKGSGFGKAACEDDFSVDKTRQQEEVDKMDAHLRKGLVIGVFPEGKMNGTPEEIASFRRGTFAQAIKHAVPIYAITFSGATDCWPRKAKIGGLPCTIQGRLDKLATPDGTETAPDAAARLAEECRGAMQKTLNAMRPAVKPSRAISDAYPVTGGD